MDKQALISIITDQKTDINLKKDIIPRDEIKEIKKLSKSGQIIIVSGIRRCGKSTLLQEIRQWQKEKDFYINFDDDRLINFTVNDFQLLLEVFIELYGVQKTFYFDEIQNIFGWERFVRRIHDKGYKVYITGSNASLLSRELGTHLTGRYIQVELYPFSFREYLNYKDKSLLEKKQYSTEDKGLIKRHFSNYLKYGGFPEYIKTREKKYLDYLYESILYRDIITRYNLASSERTLKELIYYFASNIGKNFSYNSVKNLLGLGSATTISDYCSYFQNSYLAFFINRYDYSLKKQIRSEKKSYFIDLALAREIGFYFSQDRGRILENIVYLELKRREKDIYFHKSDKECDFIIRKGVQIKQAIQVCVDMSNKDTKTREYEGLLEAIKQYGLNKGYILTQEEEREERIAVEGKKIAIYIIPVWKWLLIK